MSRMLINYAKSKNPVAITSTDYNNLNTVELAEKIVDVLFGI